MTSFYTISYILNLILFISTPFIFIYLIMRTYGEKYYPFKKTSIAAYVLGATTPIAFSAAQLYWMTQDGEGMSLLSQYIWLTFDFLNAAYYLLSAVIALVHYKTMTYFLTMPKILEILKKKYN